MTSEVTSGPPHEGPVLGLVLWDALPPDFAGDVEARLSAPDMPVRVDRMRMGPFAGVGLHLPTAVMLFVSAGYFNGFHQKLGEDHYGFVKGAARSLFRRASALSLQKIGSPGKAGSSGFSLAYSVTGELVPGLRLKLVLQADIDGETGEPGGRRFPRPAQAHPPRRPFRRGTRGFARTSTGRRRRGGHVRPPDGHHRAGAAARAIRRRLTA